jgi:addiction module RelB/DinJ family antitoxin
VLGRWPKGEITNGRRIDAGPHYTVSLKKSASAVLKRIGLTTSDAFRLMMVRIAAEKKLPFDPLVPFVRDHSANSVLLTDHAWIKTPRKLNPLGC